MPSSSKKNRERTLPTRLYLGRCSRVRPKRPIGGNVAGLSVVTEHDCCGTVTFIQVAVALLAREGRIGLAKISPRTPLSIKSPAPGVPSGSFDLNHGASI
jgi:hypothetical protein